MDRIHPRAAFVFFVVVAASSAAGQTLNPVLSPGSLTFKAGSSGQVVARTLNPPPPSPNVSPLIPPFIAISLISPGAVTITPSQAQLTSETYATGVTFTVRSSTPGTYAVPIRFQPNGGTQAPETAVLVVTVTPAITPVIDAISPPSVVAPSLATTLRVGGKNFAPGGVVFSRSPGVIVERTTVFGPTLAEVVGSPGTELEFAL